MAGRWSPWEARLTHCSPATGLIHLTELLRASSVLGGENAAGTRTVERQTFGVDNLMRETDFKHTSMQTGKNMVKKQTQKYIAGL